MSSSWGTAWTSTSSTAIYRTSASSKEAVMDQMAYKPDEALGHLPELLRALLNVPKRDIRGLTRTKVAEAIRAEALPSEAGVYLFSRKADDTPVYVGRSASLTQRIGVKHRSTQKNQA